MLYLSSKRIVSVLEHQNDWLQDNPEESLKQIYSDNYSWLEGYILQNSGSVSDAQDVFQEGIAAAWLNLRSGKFNGSRDRFNAYVRQICKYKWIDTLRSGNRVKVSYTGDIPERATRDELDLSLEQTGTLKKCFTRLGEKCRSVLGLFYYERRSLAEIAAGMENTEDSIKTIKYRCMMQLRKYFLEEMKKNGGI